MEDGHSSPTSIKRRKQERRRKSLAVILILAFVILVLLLVPYLQALRQETAGRLSVDRWLENKPDIRERYLSYSCDQVIPPFGVDTTYEIFELYKSSKSAPHWSTWRAPDRIPLEPPYEVEDGDEFEPYVDDQVDRYTSDHVEAQLMVLGYHNTGTSMLSKLLLLMGAYGGAKNNLMIGETNKLKYFERNDVISANQKLQFPYEKALHSKHKFHQVKGYIVANATKTDLDLFNKRASDVIRKLNTHPVWFTKDPRLCLVLDFWMPHVTRPVCVIAYRHPVVLSQRLLHHGAKSNMAQGDLHRFAAQWERYMINSLRNCVGHPTIIVPTTLAAVPYHTVLLGYLWRELRLAGVPGLHVPRRDFLQAHYDRYFDPKNIKGTYSGVPDTCGRLEHVEEEWEGTGGRGAALRGCTLRDISEVGLGVNAQYSWCSRDGAQGSEQSVMHLTPPQKALVGVLEEWMEERFGGVDKTDQRDVSQMLINRVTDQLLGLLQ